MSESKDRTGRNAAPGGRGNVVVGYDGSPGSERALHWAVREARLRYLPLVICHAFEWPFPTRLTTPEGIRNMFAAAERVAEEGVARAGALDPRLRVESRLGRGSPAAVLLGQSRDAEVVIVGARGGGGFADLEVGSVAMHLCAYADRPVVVVRGDPRHAEPSDRPHIVAGVNGSASADPTLAFAFEEAALRRASLRVVCSWWDPGATPQAPQPPFTHADERQRQSAARFQRAVAPWMEKYAHVEAETAFVVEPPRQALLEAAATASLLVIGGRGPANDLEPRLGPVAQAALDHSPCPVAVAHPSR